MSRRTHVGKAVAFVALARLLLCATSHLSAEEWRHDDLRFRLSVEATSSCERPGGWPVEFRLDAARWLPKIKTGAQAGMRLLVKVVGRNGEGRPGSEVVSQFDADPGRPSRGELVWLLPTSTSAGETMGFTVYFDVSDQMQPAAQMAERVSVRPSSTTANSFWVDNALMRLELVPNGDPGAPCRDLIHSWVRHDEDFDIAHRSLSVLSNPCWLNGADGWRCYGSWPFKWRLARKQAGPVRATFWYECDHSVKRDEKDVPLLKMDRRVSVFLGQPFVRDSQSWQALRELRGLDIMAESYFESKTTFSGFGRFRDLGYLSRGPRTFVHLLNSEDERCYTHHFSSEPRTGAWSDGQHLTMDHIEIGDVKQGQTIDYTVYQLYDRRRPGESPHACATRWQRLLTSPMHVRPVAFQRRGGPKIDLTRRPEGTAEVRRPQAAVPERVSSVWRPTSDRPTIIPAPQRIAWGQGAFVLGPDVTIQISAQATQEDGTVATMLRDELAEICGAKIDIQRGERDAGRCAIDLRLDASTAIRKEGYTLDASDSGVVIVGADRRGLFYGTQTLLQLVSADREGRPHVPVVSIQDWPDMGLRGFHLCFQAGRVDVDLAKRLIRYGIARSKMNTLVIEIEGGVKLHSHPEIARPDALTQSELRDIVGYAKSHFLEVIPQIQSLGHCDYWLFRGGQHKDLAETPDRPYDYCPSNPAVYQILFDIYDEILPIFEPRYFHIGYDEVRDLGVCPRCKGRAPHELFASDVKRLHGFLAKKGLRVMMWPDMLVPWRNGGPPRDVHKALDLLPKDIVMCDWDYRSAREFKGVSYFREAGFETTVTPWYDPTNNCHFASAGRAAGALGLIGSTWCGVKEPLPKYFGGLLLSAEYAWSLGRPDVKELPYPPLPQLARQLTPEPIGRASRGLLLDLGPLCNRSFRDQEGAAGMGWLGFGPRHDMSALTPGKQWLQGTLFKILDAGETGRLCIVLRGTHRFTSDKSFPTEIRGIVVNAKVSSLVFLHTCGWPTDRGQRVGHYRVHYEDGETCDLPVVYGDNVLEWNSRRPRTVLKAEIAWQGETAVGDNALLFSWRWHNPRPGVKVTTLDFAASDTPASPILVAVTCHCGPD